MIYLPDGEIMQVRANETHLRAAQVGAPATSCASRCPTAPRLTRWYHQSGAVEFGPLLMAFQPKEDWQQLDNGDWQVTTEENWNWALLRDEPMKAVVEGERDTAFGKGGPGVKVLAKAAPVEWDHGRRQRRQRADGARPAGTRPSHRAQALRRHRPAHRPIPHRHRPRALTHAQWVDGGARSPARCRAPKFSL